MPSLFAMAASRRLAPGSTFKVRLWFSKVTSSMLPPVQNRVKFLSPNIRGMRSPPSSRQWSCERTGKSLFPFSGRPLGNKEEFDHHSWRILLNTAHRGITDRKHKAPDRRRESPDSRTQRPWGVAKLRYRIRSSEQSGKFSEQLFASWSGAFVWKCPLTKGTLYTKEGQLMQTFLMPSKLSRTMPAPLTILSRGSSGTKVLRLVLSSISLSRPRIKAPPPVR